MAGPKARIMTEKYQKFLKCRNKSLACPVCGFEVKVGQMAQPRRGYKPEQFKLYHQVCWDSLFLLTDEDKELEKELAL